MNCSTVHLLRSEIFQKNIISKEKMISIKLNQQLLLIISEEKMIPIKLNQELALFWKKIGYKAVLFQSQHF